MRSRTKDIKLGDVNRKIEYAARGSSGVPGPHNLRNHVTKTNEGPARLKVEPAGPSMLEGLSLHTQANPVFQQKLVGLVHVCLRVGENLIGSFAGLLLDVFD